METRGWIQPSSRPLKEEPATYMQLSWLSALDSPVCTDSVTVAWDLRGQLDLDVLRETARRVIARHESLRTNYVRDEAGVRQVVWSAEVPDLPLIDLSAQAPAEAEAEVQRAMLAEAERPVALTESALWRGFVLRVTPRHHVLVTAGHHSMIDATSQQILHADLLRTYRDVWRGCADTAPSFSLPAQLADFARAERMPLSRHAQAYWRAQLGSVEPLDWPHSQPPKTGRYRTVTTELPTITPTQLETLRKVADSVGASLGTALCAVVAAALSPFADVAIPMGFVHENRDAPERKNLIGPVAAHLPLRIEIYGNPSFAELVARADHAWADAVRFSAPLGAIRRSVGGDTNGGPPLYEVAVNLLPEPGALGVVDELPGADGGLLTMAARQAVGARQPEFDHEFDGLPPMGIVLFPQDDGSLAAMLYSANTTFATPTLDLFGRMFGGVVVAIASNTTEGIRSLARQVAAE